MNLVTQDMIKKYEEQHAIEMELEASQSYADTYGSFAEAIKEFELKQGKDSAEC